MRAWDTQSRRLGSIVEPGRDVGKANMIGRSYAFGTTSALFVSALLAIAFHSTSARAQCIQHFVESTVPCGITLVGTTGGVADPRGEFIVVIRDLASNPMPNCEVAIDFGDCEPDIRIAPNQPHPGLRVECDTNGTRVIGTTDANGTIVFRIVGAASAASGGPAGGFKCGMVRAGDAYTTINVAAYDLNGGGGTNAADLSLWLTDNFDSDDEGRSDFNCSNTIGAADFSILLQGVFSGGSSQSASSFCF